MAAVAFSAVAYADNVVNTLDTSVDATKETMNLTAGGAPGATYVWVQNTNSQNSSDTNNACNLASAASLTVNVLSGNTAVATVSPSAVTIDDCSTGDTGNAVELAKMRQITVTPVSPGTTDITFTQNAFNGSGTFNYATATFTVVVEAEDSNEPPTASAGGPYSVGEASSAGLSGSGSDSDGDPLTYAWDLDNDGSFETPGQNVTFSAAGRDGPDTQTVKLQVCDDEGSCATSSATVNITNVAPSIGSVTNNGPVDEGSPASVTVDATDPAGALDPLSYEFDCDDDSAYEVGPQAGNSAQCTYPDGPSSHTVNVRVSDGDGGTDTDSTTVHVGNVDPTVATPTFQITSINCRTSVTLSRIGFNDPGADADWTVEIDWDDGSTTSYETASKGVQPVQTHQYDTPGTYTATVTVTDKDGGVGSNTSSNSLVVQQTYTVDFLPPFDDSTPSALIVNKMKSGRVVPVKATIYDDCALSFVTDPNADVTITTSKTSGTGAGDSIEEYADAGQSSGDTNEFRWSDDGFWIYNLDSKALGLVVNNLYRVDIYVDSVKATVANWAVLQPVK